MALHVASWLSFEHVMLRPGLGLVAILLIAAACGRDTAPPKSPVAVRPSILLVTLDTTRADAIGPEAVGVRTPAFNALAARGRRFRQAYASVPETLPSHSSMMTGLYPAGHGVHENGRYLPADHAVAAERLKQAGYRTIAFVSAFSLAHRFGLARGFDLYDDEWGRDRAERTARDTTDAAIAELQKESAQPLFAWVHYYDPHTPYAPPAPFRDEYAKTPYLGEVAAMDHELGRLIQAFEQRARGPAAIVVVADHGEGLGDHGEPQHGHLLYQSTMHVPLVIVGPGVDPGTTDAPVSTRRVFHTLLDWAGVDAANSLRAPSQDIVLGEAMKPFLEFGWQPQVMSVDGAHKAIRSGKLEVYDVVADPDERRDLGAEAGLSTAARTALWDYPAPSPDAARSPENLSADARHKLASLGYVSAGAAPVVRKDAPRPADMTGLFDELERASAMFAAEQYARVIPLLEKILATDPQNLDAWLRLATAHSSLGHRDEAGRAFAKASQLAPSSPDVRLYAALHEARGPDWIKAIPALEQIVAEAPERLPALEALAVLAMRAGQTTVAIDSFEKARALQGNSFRSDLELGVLYLSVRRFDNARQALDRALATEPRHAMALFKRAQVSVLLNEPDRAARIELARRHADHTTGPLIANERLFRR
jgi:choline-sulfatase